METGERKLKTEMKRLRQQIARTIKGFIKDNWQPMRRDY